MQMFKENREERGESEVSVFKELDEHLVNTQMMHELLHMARHERVKQIDLLCAALVA